MAPVIPLPPGCPWSGWTPPQIQWCEENLCAWITAPANTWSNVAYLIVGLMVWRAARQERAFVLRLFGPVTLAVGVTSFLFHASFTFFFQWFDFVGMYLLLWLMLTANVVRGAAVRPSRTRVVGIYLGGVTLFSLLTVALWLLEQPIQALVAVLIATLVAQEVWLRRWEQRGEEVRYGAWYAALFCFVGGVVCSVVDGTGLLCDPHNHFLQGHAAWHLLTAASVGWLYLFYRGLPGSRE